MELPDGYRLERDPELLVLRADNGRFVAAFSTVGATEGAVWEAAWNDVPSRDEHVPVDTSLE